MRVNSLSSRAVAVAVATSSNGSGRPCNAWQIYSAEAEFETAVL